MSRLVRAGLTLGLTAACTAYILWKIDVGQTVEVLADTRLAPFALAVAITVVTVIPMALRWQWLLAAKGMPDSLAWLTRAYFVSYVAGQVLPTAVGGDAVRIAETARRHPGRLGTITGSVLLERALGATATLALAAVGFVLAIGRYDVGAYLWIEGVFVVGTIVLGFLFFARSARPLLARAGPLAARLKLERPLRALYEGIHTYRDNLRLLAAVFAVTIVLQAVRILAIWLCGESVGVDISLRPYYVLGPLLLIVMMVPFTLNGLAVRESFFVSFLGNLGVGADAAFATGFLYFLTTLAVALPGVLVLAWEGFRGFGRPSVRHG